MNVLQVTAEEGIDFLLEIVQPVSDAPTALKGSFAYVFTKLMSGMS